MSIFTLLEMIAGDRPDRTAIRVDGVDTSFDRVRTLGGETVGAAIVLHPSTQVSEAELRDGVRGALRSSRVPAQIRFETQLPYSDMGKLLRRVVRTSMLAAGVS